VIRAEAVNLENSFPKRVWKFKINARQNFSYLSLFADLIIIKKRGREWEREPTKKTELI
jgi:hypothetical protein